MKQHIMNQLAFILAMFPLLCWSQKNFAPPGAIWNYEQCSEWNSTIPGCAGNHLQYVVEEEVTIDGKDCSVIRAYHSTNLDTVWRDTGDSLVIWEDHDRIYFQQDSSFLLLFDFGAGLGDTIVRYDPYNRGVFSGTYYEDTSTVANKMEMYVTELTTIEVQGENLKIQTIEYVDPSLAYLWDQILEGVGSLSESFPGSYWNCVANGCHGELICCENGNIKYETANTFAQPHPECNYMPMLDGVENSLETDLSYFPNPFNNEINISISANNFQLRLLDLNGKILRSVNNKYQLDTESLTAGSYILQLITPKDMVSLKVIKI